MLKRIAEQILPPSLFATLLSVHSRNYQQKFLQEQGLLKMSEQLAACCGLKVLHGPFKGMIYPEESITSRHGVPRLLGTYEMELHPVFEEILTKRYQGFVDIGCAEGYYAVGLAMRSGTDVYAFDTEFRERKFCRTMAELNGVADKVKMQNWCDLPFLLSLKNQRYFVLCDCEGGEINLFNGDSIPALSGCDLLIELHEVRGVDVCAAMHSRFEATHSIKLINSTTRDADSYDELKFLGAEASRAISEYRTAGQTWMYLRAKSVQSAINKF